MGQSATPRELRELLCVARLLRDSAVAADDSSDADLFLRTASALEARAFRLAYGSPDGAIDPEPHPAKRVPVDVIC